MDTIIPEPENNNEARVEKKDIRAGNVQGLFIRRLLVYDKNKGDITYLFSPKIKQLFILILMYSRDQGGITSRKISSALWPDKDPHKQKISRVLLLIT